ncbi:glycosyltransferase family 2 protein [Desertivirga xinjiangensis]|uniref:glycosyltransferase family 2 protein n=1 Tax=Desertivirga xinjiangensis TaxID=539206 RepID=UPI00210AAC55|nr:glycosyltransferase family 2 protein [Pedobacter xinjiangensis]
MNKVSVVTVNYNQALVTEELLHSISTLNSYPDTEIIVIDNGSVINPVPQWQSKYPDIHFIRSESNLGFAGGNNLGIKAATGDYLFLVNNDTEFTSGLIESLAAVLDSHPTAGMVSPKIRFFHQPDIIQYAGFTPMNYFTARNKRIGEYETDKGQYDGPAKPTGFADGAAMMVRKETVEKAGLMAEHFFLYYEEMDWCERIKRSGYVIWVEPGALIYHKESVSVGKRSSLKEYFMNRNRILFIRRNAPLIARFLFYFHFCCLVAPRNLFTYLRDKRPDLAQNFIKAIWWNITHKKDSKDLGYSIQKI